MKEVPVTQGLALWSQEDRPVKHSGHIRPTQMCFIFYVYVFRLVELVYPDHLKGKQYPKFRHPKMNILK